LASTRLLGGLHAAHIFFFYNLIGPSDALGVLLMAVVAGVGWAIFVAGASPAF